MDRACFETILPQKDLDVFNGGSPPFLNYCREVDKIRKDGKKHSFNSKDADL